MKVIFPYSHCSEIRMLVHTWNTYLDSHEGFVDGFLQTSHQPLSALRSTPYDLPCNTTMAQSSLNYKLCSNTIKKTLTVTLCHDDLP